MFMLKRFFRSAVVSAALIGLASCGATARTIEVGQTPGADYPLPSAGIAAAHDGDTVRIAAGEYFDCAFVRANNIVIEGTGPNASSVLTDKVCGGKGLLVISGNNVTVRNLTLTRARVPDGNGAGIRAEGKGLTVEGVKFINNEDGILGGADGSTMIIRNSQFIGNGGCDNPGGCAHGLYSGHLALLHIENSKFLETKRTHHIKSRSLRTEVIGCEISDSPKGTASYEIELPNGGDLLARNNTIVKGAQAENHTGAIVIGSEGVTNRTGELTIENNVFRAEGSYNTFFVVNLTATPAILIGNKISGNAKPLRGDGEVH